MRALPLWSRYAGISIRSQLQHRASFLLQATAQMVLTAIEFLAIAALFHRFGSLRGWTLAEAGVLYGMVGVAFALAEGLARGFDVFSRMVRTGDFDRLLVRPRSTAFQVLAQDVQLMRVGRLLQALVVLVACGSALEVGWSAGKVALVALAVAGGACLFVGLLVVQAALCFWTTESIEIVNCATYGGVEAAQFPLSIYRPGFRAFFTFVVPLAAVSFVPAQVILERVDPAVLPALAPLAGLAFLGASLLFWQAGVRRYRSTGS